MAVLEITSRDFRDNQKKIFELADNGEQVVIKRGKKRAYLLIPIKEDDIKLSPAMEERITEGIENITNGNTKRYSLEELRSIMGV